MKDFNSFLNGESKSGEPRRGMEVGGSFGCQICNVVVDEAEYFIVERILKWKCPEGHISFLEGFVL